MQSPNLREVRRCYSAHHPVHAAYYFAPEHDACYRRIGLDAGPMAYVAGRAAPMGVVGAGVVSAAFVNFHPDLIASIAPAVWHRASPEVILRTRLDIVDSCLTRLLGAPAVASAEMSEAAELAVRAAAAGQRQSRPMFSANADLPLPEQAHLRFWQAITMLREHRGDGHAAVLLAAELDGIEALVTDTATGTNWKPHFLQQRRGWTEADWSAAQLRLCERGILDQAGELTERGFALRRDIEAETDRLDSHPYRVLGSAGTRRLTELAGAFAKRALAAGALPLHHLGKS